MGHCIWGSLRAIEVVLQFDLLPRMGHCERKKYTLRKIVHNLDIILGLLVFGYVWGTQLCVYLWENVYCFYYRKSSLVVNLSSAQFVTYVCIFCFKSSVQFTFIVCIFCFKSSVQFTFIVCIFCFKSSVQLTSSICMLWMHHLH